MAASALVVAVLAAATLTAAPPIQNPGAPGQSTRAITAEQSVQMSRSTFTAADVRFMQHMIVHHGQAVEMNALIGARTGTYAIVTLGERISQTQATEIRFMERWLDERGQPLSDPALHTGHAMHAGHSGHSSAMAAADAPLMPGMLSPARMNALAASEGDTFDRLFLEGMIEHHRGALDMVAALLAEAGNGEDPQLSEFLTHITADQAAEILRMQTLLSNSSAAPGEEEEALRP